MRAESAAARSSGLWNSVRQMSQEIADDFPRVLGLFQPGHVAAFVDECEGGIPDQGVRFANVRFSSEVLAPLEKKNRSRNAFEFRANVIFPLCPEERRRDAEIVIVGVKFHGHFQSLLSIIEVSHRRGPQTLESGAIGVRCLS